MVDGEAPQGSDSLSEQAAAILRQVEEASRKANSEAGFAFNAKQMAEQHATAISSLKGQAEADAGWFTTSKQASEAAQAVIANVKAEAESAQRAVTEALGEVEKIRAAVKSAGEAGESARGEAEKYAAEANANAKAAALSATTAASTNLSASNTAGKIEALLAKATEQAEKAQEHSTEIDTLLQQVTKDAEAAKVHVAAMAATSKRAGEAFSIVEQHGKDLEALKGQFEALKTRIEGLLPYAASASLATAFREQKARFERPQWMWLGTFVATIVGLMLSSLWGLPTGDSWEGIGRHLVNRLPLIGPLIWLAIYAGRHYNLTLRLQEEYAYKEAVSAAFEGYKREMSTVGTRSDGGSPLVTLCENVLTTLGQRPGRIYESKPEDITPLTSLAATVKDAAVAAKEAAQVVTTAAKG
jgi:chemotaxis protein histidine kinase CheA